MHDRKFCIVNKQIKILLPSPAKAQANSQSEDGNSIVMQLPNQEMDETLSPAISSGKKSILSGDAPIFTPKSRSKTNFVSNHAEVRQLQRKQIILPCYGIDSNIHQYNWNIDSKGNFIAGLNTNIPPPKFVSNAILVPTRVKFTRAHGELFVDQLGDETTVPNAKGFEDVGVQVEPAVIRYNRDSLLNLINAGSSQRIPTLRREIHNSINNRDCQTVLQETLGIASPSTTPNDSAFDSTFSIRKSFSLTDNISPSVDSSSNLRKSYSFTDVSTSTIRKFRSCLNKLSEGNFNAILKELKDIKVHDDETVFKFTEILYQKAIQEPIFCSQYVKVLMALKNDFVVAANRKTFEELVVATCEKHHEDAKRKLDEIIDASCQTSRDLLRHQLLGSMRFIAEMYKQRLLSLDFVMMILQDFISVSNVESIEPLCKLLEYLYDVLPSDEHIKSIFSDLVAIQNNFPTRTRFAIENLLLKCREVIVHENAPEEIGEIGMVQKCAVRSQNRRRKRNKQQRRRRRS